MKGLGKNVRRKSNLHAPTLLHTQIKTSRALRKDGFELDKQRAGAHQQNRNPEDGRRVTVSFHRGGETFAVKTLKSMVEQQAEWTEEDLKRLGLLK